MNTSDSYLTSSSSTSQKSVIEQANDALMKHRTVQIKAVKERLSALGDDIMYAGTLRYSFYRSAQNELGKMEQLLDNLLSEIPNGGSTNRLENRKIRSLELEIETKARLIAFKNACHRFSFVDEAY
ncbi:unnamed protein product [Trichobilharzia regenti]|nr:unnamed protein product [Trichobilharzia regenti]